MAGKDSLFLEHYLETSVEQLLSRSLGHAVSRRDIVEVGNLASTGKGAALILFLVLANFLEQRGVRYAVVTATRSLHQFFVASGFDPIELGPANPARLPDGGAAWGRYYDENPRVLAGCVVSCQARLAHFAAAMPKAMGWLSCGHNASSSGLML